MMMHSCCILVPTFYYKFDQLYPLSGILQYLQGLVHCDADAVLYRKSNYPHLGYPTYVRSNGIEYPCRCALTPLLSMRVRIGTDPALLCISCPWVELWDLQMGGQRFIESQLDLGSIVQCFL